MVQAVQSFTSSSITVPACQPLQHAPTPAPLPLNAANGVIAYSAPAGSGLTQIFTINENGTNQQQLTSSGENFYPAWTKDGTKIAFTSTRTGTPEIWMMDADGANQSQITSGTLGGNFIPEWSHDGTKIVYASQLNKVGHPEIWAMNADGTNLTRLTFTPPNPPGQPTWSVHPHWSPDGQAIVYASTTGGSTQIWMMNADGSNQHPITSGLGPNYPDANAPDWSLDGSRIVFWAGFETMFGEIWSMNPDGSDPVRLTDTLNPLNSDNPAWSPDGTKILVDTNRSGGAPEIWLMNADGTNPMLLIPGASGPIAWQPLPLIPGCSGDIAPPAVGNGVVNIDDLVAVLNSFGPCPQMPPLPCLADIAPPTLPAGNGTVNIDDLVALLNAFGPCP